MTCRVVLCFLLLPFAALSSVVQTAALKKQQAEQHIRASQQYLQQQRPDLAIPELQKRGGGVILHIAARSGMLGQSGRAAYCASKGGMVRLTEAMAMDHAKDGIRVNCICPGPTRTPMVDTSTPEKLARYKTRVPLGRIGEPDDVAYAALYLASDEASMVTAAILPVDGGMRLTGP